MREYVAVIGIGSNVGDRRAMIDAAVERLSAEPGIVVEAVSPIYETEAVGPPQPDFLNGAARVRTTLDPHGLLDRLLAIEATLGRTRRVRWGPRTIDLDILFIAGESVESDRLSVPHPRLLERAFALAPLLDLLDNRPQGLAARLSSLGGPPRRASPK